MNLDTTVLRGLFGRRDSVHDMLRYIKRSGVGGGVKQLGYKEMKSLMLEYPLKYLEFEVIFVKVLRKK